MNIGIKSDDRLAAEITGRGKSQAKGLELASVLVTGAFSLGTEDRCNETYAEGRTETGRIKQYLEDTYRYMDQISQTFLEADRMAAKTNLEAAVRQRTAAE